MNNVIYIITFLLIQTFFLFLSRITLAPLALLICLVCTDHKMVNMPLPYAQDVVDFLPFFSYTIYLALVVISASSSFSHFIVISHFSRKKII